MRSDAPAHGILDVVKLEIEASQIWFKKRANQRRWPMLSALVTALLDKGPIGFEVEAELPLLPYGLYCDAERT